MEVLRLDAFIHSRSKLQRECRAQAGGALFKQFRGQGFALLSLGGDDATVVKLREVRSLSPNAAGLSKSSRGEKLSLAQDTSSTHTAFK